MDRRRSLYLMAALASLSLVAWSAVGAAPFGLTETLGFVSGAWCVWLTVLANIWNWPIGIANSAFYLVVFLNVRLFADMSLQIVYIVLGFLGWYWWLRGGERHDKLSVRRVGAVEAVAVGLAVAGATAGMARLLCGRSTTPRRPRRLYDLPQPGRAVPAHPQAVRELVPVDDGRRRVHQDSTRCAGCISPRCSISSTARCA